jgi:hypothetical protein
MLSEQPLDPITKDMRRRLFWTLASMEYVLLNRSFPRMDY